MPRCPTCAAEVPVASRFCLSCGAALHGSAVPTIAMPERRPSSSSASDEGRFPAGTLLGERYKIVGLLGRGGMGEVYRAHDLKLEQQVALKFLPPATARDTRLLERFRGEVRIARQVSHRNVCRVYDLGEIDGSPFISMEYVDGEDLGSVLRRFGRLPQDKAIEFARRLCAGLNAAHEKGVLHRDLKPANVMIDGQGQLLIMDFGLAAAADAIAGGDIRSGTPAYMAPEQKEGREVTVRSDIYSLGLVLTEMFTGQKDSKLSGTVKDLDPAVKKVIQRCLDPNPSKRPQSALDVARALPGGDPLAEALAAGDTPSPEMVAASEDTGALSVRAAVLCLAFIIAGIIAAILLSGRTNPLRRAPFAEPPEIMARTAREIAASLGYTDPPADSAYGFISRSPAALVSLNPEEYKAATANARTAPIVFWYRQSPRGLIPVDPGAEISINDPPESLPGMVTVGLDSDGHCFYFHAIPPRAIDFSQPASADWTPLFDAAGLDPSKWKPAEPDRNPPIASDQQAAWIGEFPYLPSRPFRIDAAALKGRPVMFEIRGAGEPLSPEQFVPSRPTAALWLFIGLPSILVASAGLLAWRNFRRGSGDTHGALRLSAFAFACNMIAWLLLTRHTSGTAEIGRIETALSRALAWAAVLWMLYIALEPYVRRRWPQSLISWTRLLNGGVRDPVVAGHLLLGTAFGIAYMNFVRFEPSFLAPFQLTPLMGPGAVIGSAVGELGTVVLYATFLIFFLVFLLRAILRRTWLAAAFVVLLASGLVWAIGYPWIIVGLVALMFSGAVAILIRYGVLPMVTAVFVDVGLMRGSPLTTDFSLWYASSMFTAIAIVLALALWSFRNALGGRKVWKGEFLDS